jgi:hypothetical protein
MRLEEVAAMDMQEFIKNRYTFPPDELMRYVGKYVAWSPDRTRILASDEDERRLDATLKRAGHDMSEVLVSYVPFTDCAGALLWDAPVGRLPTMAADPDPLCTRPRGFS